MKYVENKGQTLLHWQDVLFKKQNQILTSLSTIIALNSKINEYEEGKITEESLKGYINNLYDQSFNVLQDPTIE